MTRSQETPLRRRLARNLVALALISVLLLAGVNFLVVRSLLNESVDAQLVSLSDARRQALERGFTNVASQVSTAAREPGVVQALVALSTAYDEIDEELSDSQIAEMEALYDTEVFGQLDAAGIEHRPSSDLVPNSNAGRYVQYNYTTANSLAPEDRRNLNDAGDGSAYSEAHATHHSFLNQLAISTNSDDLILISADSEEVVYSAKKRVDIGTDVVDGVYSADVLGRVVNELPRVGQGKTAIADTSFYLPDVSSPLLFFAASVRTESRVVGAIVMQIPVEAVTALTTAGQNWDLLGLGETGETYIVGPDLTMRSDSRLWLEDPEEYRKRFDSQNYPEITGQFLEATNSPVLVQPVDNEGVRAALEGDEFIGTVNSYLGGETLASIVPLSIPGIKWVAVAEQSTDEATDALDKFVRTILVMLAILLPIIALIGTVIARGLVRPINPLVAAASGIAEGDLEPDLPELGNNELGDLARQLERVAQQLDQQDHALLEEEARITEMLTAIIPSRLIERVRNGEREIADMLDTATVVSLTVVGMPDPSGSDQEAVLEATARITAELDRLADRHSVERIQISADHQLFLAGLASEDSEAGNAALFALDVSATVEQVGTELGAAITSRVGLSAGDVATGVLGTNQLSFGVWGDPPGRAVTLDSLAQPGEVLIDPTVLNQLGDNFTVRPLETTTGLSDDAIEAFVLEAARV